jgi:pseudaminic acid cytidylyltransferase
VANIAIIPARSGSKRIPGKNIRDFRGKPIIAYPIEAAINCGLFDVVMVSTDSPHIAAVARQYGAQVPFFRSETNSSDNASTASVIKEVIENFQIDGTSFELACCIYATAPFVDETSLQSGFKLITHQSYKTVFSVAEFSYPVLRALKMDTKKKVSMIWPENLNKRSQDLEPVFHDAGQFYWIIVDEFLKEGKLFTDNSGVVLLDALKVQDIDNEADWQIAELKHSILFPNDDN